MIVAVGLLVSQTIAACAPGASGVAARAEARARVLDVAGAIALYEQAAEAGCGGARVSAVYLRGLQAARDAYREGGSEPSLVPARAAEAVLAREAARGDRRAEVARYVLMAAAAAAQSERGDVAIFLDQALQLERKLAGAARASALPIPAHEAAGDLWLQVHRFEMAREAYERAAVTFGLTPRVALGLARTAFRLEQPAAACASFRQLLTLLGDEAAARAEGSEASRFLASERCSP